MSWTFYLILSLFIYYIYIYLHESRGNYSIDKVNVGLN